MAGWDTVVAELRAVPGDVNSGAPDRREAWDRFHRAAQQRIGEAAPFPDADLVSFEAGVAGRGGDRHFYVALTRTVGVIERPGVDEVAMWHATFLWRFDPADAGEPGLIRMQAQVLGAFRSAVERHPSWSRLLDVPPIAGSFTAGRI